MFKICPVAQFSFFNIARRVLVNNKDWFWDEFNVNGKEVAHSDKFAHQLPNYTAQHLSLSVGTSSTSSVDDDNSTAKRWSLALNLSRHLQLILYIQPIKFYWWRKFLLKYREPHQIAKFFCKVFLFAVDLGSSICTLSSIQRCIELTAHMNSSIFPTSSKSDLMIRHTPRKALTTFASIMKPVTEFQFRSSDNKKEFNYVVMF